jgi:hypothetical protein
VPVGDPEVPEGGGRDDVDLHSLGPYVLDGLGDEAAGGVPGEPGIRRRQDGDSHA